VIVLPIGDHPNPEGYIPLVTWGLIVINVLIYVFFTVPMGFLAANPMDPMVLEFLPLVSDAPPSPHLVQELAAQLSSYDLFVLDHGFRSSDPSLADLFSSMFLHAGLMHLAGNMLFLWIYGDNVEHRVGRLGFLMVYLVTGAVATLSWALVSWGSPVPLIGASGAISGVLGMYFVLFKRNQVRVLVAFFPFFFRSVMVKARFVLAFYVLVDNLLPVLVASESSVAYGAHLGGFVAGAVVALIGERLEWAWPWADRIRSVGVGHPDPSEADLERLQAALSEGEVEDAVKVLRGLSQQDVRSLSAQDTLSLAEWLAGHEHAVAGGRLLRQALRWRGEATERALLFFGLALMRMAEDQRTAAYQHLMTALDLGPDPHTEVRIRHALAAIEPSRGTMH
jgi:membrane associated rhomboid family serine protease